MSSASQSAQSVEAALVIVRLQPGAAMDGYLAGMAGVAAMLCVLRSMFRR